VVGRRPRLHARPAGRLKATDLERQSTLWSHRLFFNGEERVTQPSRRSSGPRQRGDRDLPLQQMVDEGGTLSSSSDLVDEVVGTEAKSWATCSQDPAQANAGYNELFL